MSESGMIFMSPPFNSGAQYTKAATEPPTCPPIPFSFLMFGAFVTVLYEVADIPGDPPVTPPEILVCNATFPFLSNDIPPCILKLNALGEPLMFTPYE